MTSTVTPPAGAGGTEPSGLPATPARTRPVGSVYRGREGMWSWVAHRITGVLTFFFLFTHVLDIALVRVSPDTFDRVIDSYKNPFINLSEFGLVGAVLYHALNGLRIISIDFWKQGPRFQRQMLWAIVVIWVVCMGASLWPMLGHSVENLVGSTP